MLATRNDTNSLSLTTQTVVRITWESNASADYSWTTVTNWGTTNSITNSFSNQYLYGKQEYSQVVRYDEDNGFEMAASNCAWFNLANYIVSPLLWGEDLYKANALTTTVPTIAGTYQAAGQSGRYIYNWATNAWPYYVTNVVSVTNDGVVSQVTNVTIKVPEFNTNNVITNQFGDIIGEITNLPFTLTTSYVERVFLDYSPTNQRPNAITPLMGRDHLLVLDAKFLELVPKYYNDTVAVGGSFDAYCATAGVYWVSNYYVGPIWFEMGAVTETTNRTYVTSLPVPGGIVDHVATNYTTGSATNYTTMAVSTITNNIAGTEGDHDFSVIGVGPIYTLISHWGPSGSITDLETPPKAGWLPYSGPFNWVYDYYYPMINPVGPFYGSLTWYTTAWGTVEDTRVVTNSATSTTNVPAGTYQTNVIGGADVEGAGEAGEIDYYWEENAGTETNYTRRVYVDTTTGTATNYTSLTYSNHTIDGSSSHYNRTTPRVQSDRVYIWAGVSNLLASYMTPWVVDHTNSSTVGNTNYYDQYLYNHGWSPTYSTGWRLYSETLSAVGYNYFWDWTTTNYFHANYDYYLVNTNSDAPPFHHPRSYTYLEAPHTEYLIMSETWWWFEEPVGWGWNYQDPTTNYYKYQPEVVTNYTLDVLTTYYIITEPLYTIKYQVHPESPPFYAVTSFWAAHSNTLGGTNWLLNPSYLCETQTIVSSNTMSVTNVDIADWVVYDMTNTVVTKTAVYSNDWAISLWGGSFVQRYDATELLQWPAGAAWMESENRSLYTTNVAATGWSSQSVITNLTGGNYAVSISRGGYGSYYTFTASRVRVRRKPGGVLGGAIDVYTQFGTALSGRYDLGSIGYSFGPYIRVSELCLAAGDDVSGWLGSISSAPIYPDLVGYSWEHPYGFTIQNASSAAIFVFKPEF